MTDINTAKDDIARIFYDAWVADDLSKDIVVFFDKKDDDASSKSSDSSWSRLTIRHFDGGFRRQSLVDSGRKKSYQRDGIVTVGIFTPIGEGTSLDNALASIVMNAFEGKSTPNGVWFRNARFNEVGVSSAWFQTNVKVDFNYSEIK